MIKGLSMAVFGLWVIAATTYAALTSPVPSAATMGSIGALALFANIVCALLLFRYHAGSAISTHTQSA